MTSHVLDERRDFGRTLRATEPDAPTLCGDWTAALLTAHLVRRERSVGDLLGRLPVAALRARAEGALADLVSRRTYAELVAQFEAGPPVPSPFAVPVVRDAVNLLEYVVHHEDVRRAGLGAAPRALPVARQRAVWQRLRVAAPLTMHGLALPVALEWPGHGTIPVHRMRKGPAAVTVSGEPVELALLAFGRQGVAVLDYAGSDADVATVRDADISI